MRNIFRFSFLVVSVICLVSCEKLPKPTESGKQTFGCYVDGKKWRPKGQSLDKGAYPPIRASAFRRTSGKILTISAFFGNQSIQLYLNPPSLNTGDFPLGNASQCCDFNYKSHASFEIQNGRDYQDRIVYVTDSLHTGQILITRFDEVAKIVAGRFSFTGYDLKSGRTIEVKDGRFDVNFSGN